MGRDDCVRDSGVHVPERYVLQLQHLDAGDDAGVHGYRGVHFLLP